MPEMKGIIPGSFYQLFGEEQHLGSHCLIIWGAQREHCVRGQICSVAGSIWWWDAYLGANEMPGGVTVIRYHPPPSLTPPHHRHKPALYERRCRQGIGCTSDLRGKTRAAQARTLHAKPVPAATHTCMHALVQTHARASTGSSGKLPHTGSNHTQLSLATVLHITGPIPLEH